MNKLKWRGQVLAAVIGIGCVCQPVMASAEADIDRGVQAAQRADHLTALGLFQIHAAQGHAIAQYNLGLLYLHGLGVPQSRAQAQYWLTQSAEQNYAKAQLALEQFSRR